MQGRKIRLLWHGDISANTGFASVTGNILKQLYKTGSYDIFALGVNYWGFKHEFPFHIYPAVAGGDPHGFRALTRVIGDCKPDILVELNDLWLMPDVYKILDNHFPEMPIIVYYLPDGGPFQECWVEMAKRADKGVVCSDFGYNSAKKKNKDMDVDVVKYGVDYSVFRPLAISESNADREQIGWEDRFVITNVNRFQPRKMVPLTIRAAKLFSGGYKICGKCGNWYPLELDRCDLNGCSELDVKKEVQGHKDALLYLHMNTHEPSVGRRSTDNLLSLVYNIGFNDKNDNVVHVQKEDCYGEKAPSPSSLNRYYNASDVYFTTALGEGAGLTIHEALSTGTSVVAPNNSAIPELLKGTDCVPYLNSDFVWLPHDNAMARPIPDVRSAIPMLEMEYSKWKKNGRKKDFNLVKRMRSSFNWDDSGKKFNEIVKNVLFNVKYRCSRKKRIDEWEKYVNEKNIKSEVV